MDVVFSTLTAVEFVSGRSPAGRHAAATQDRKSNRPMFSNPFLRFGFVNDDQTLEESTGSHPMG